MYRLLNDVSLDQQLESTIYCPSHGGGGGDQYRRGEDHLSHPSHPIPTFKLKSILHLSLSLLSSSRPFPAYRARVVVVVVVCRLIAGRPGTFDAYAGVERLRETAATTDFKVA